MTRRAVISVLAMLLAAVCSFAKPARQGLSVYRQPDGTKITVRIYGDEFNHYVTDASGNVLELDANGFYRISASGNAAAKRNAVRRRSRPRGGAYMSSGERHIPVLLIEFADVHFSFDGVKDMFDALLNQEGYDYEGSTGSVRDFYTENSNGLFTPVFDVMEPVRLDKNMSAYGANVGMNDKAPELALFEACVALDESVDFSVYDQDDDGEIDMILYYYAGYDEAEAGPSDAIWSHQWTARESSIRKVLSSKFDDKYLGRYFCTSELSGNTGARFTGIGTTCHEFAHSIGLPDFYDTDDLTNGYAGGFYSYSTMCYGCYNNDGRTPPYFNMLERQMLGWYAGDFPELPEGDLAIPAVQGNVAFMTPAADNEGEFFIWEFRDGTGWDSPLPAGLLLYHIDKSSNPVGDYTAGILWEEWDGSDLATANKINAYGSHPCAYIVPSSAPGSLNYKGADNGIVFPGVSGTVFLDRKDWSGSGTQFKVADIRVTASGASVHVIKGHDSIISGKVSSNEGTPVPGALIGADITDQFTVSDAEGHFVLDLPDGTVNVPFQLAVSGEGYRKLIADGALDGRSVFMPVSLMKAGETSVAELSKWDKSALKIFFPLPSRDYGDCMGAVHFTPDDLFPFTGRRLEEVSFYNYISDEGAEAVYVIVDFGDTRVLTREVEQPLYGVKNLNTVNISDANLRIPDGTDVYIGYGVKGSAYPFPLAVTRTGHEDNSFYAPLNLDKSAWEPMFAEKISDHMDLLLSAGVREVLDDADISMMGYATIDLGNKAWQAGDTLPLNLKAGPFEPVSVTWLFDGEIALEGSVLLTKGVHTVQAIVRYSGGRSENLKAIITCE